MLTAVGKVSLRRFGAPALFPGRLTTLPMRQIPACVAVGPQYRSLTLSLALEQPATAAPSDATRKTTAAKDKNPALKKKKAAAKPKAKKLMVKKKKTLTPEQKEAAEKKKLYAEKQALKAEALLKEQPVGKPVKPWLLYVTTNLTGASIGRNLGSATKPLGEAFRSLPETEIQRLQEEVEKNKATNAANLKAWVESHPPATIYAANQARARLSRKFKVETRSIPDERLPKKGSSAFNHFVKQRWASGDLPSGNATGLATRIGNEWKNLTTDQKAEFNELAAKEAANYQSEMEKIFKDA